MNPEELGRGLWTFPIVLPENPLKWLNCYVIKGGAGERSLLIDTGFNRPECLADLLAGMEALALEPESTDVFLTHMHSDHTGNAAALQARGCRLLMGKGDYLAHAEDGENDWVRARQRARREGMPQDVMDEVFRHNPATLYRSGPYTAETVSEGDSLSYGGYRLRCVETPGHTPGHMCLYEADRKILFLGDHVLFDITPNIGISMRLNDTLGHYLDSLDKIMEYDVTLALPGHRQRSERTVRERAQELKRHHRTRLGETERIVFENPGMQAYEIAGHMTWRIRSRNWEEFPPGQKWFAVVEAMSHLDYLEKRGFVERLCAADGSVAYCSTGLRYSAADV